MKTKTHIPKGMNLLAFGLSAFFVIYGLWNISTTLWIQIVSGILGFYVEWEAWSIWGLSFAYKEAKQRYKWMRALYIIYIIIFALPSAIGFFATEIDAQDTISSQMQTASNDNRDRIAQLKKLIDSARVDMDYERDKNGGTGDKFLSDKAEMDRYNAELTDRQVHPEKYQAKIETRTVKKDMFAAVSKVLWGFPKYALILIMFMAALVMVYIGLMLNPPEITLGEVKTTLTNIPDSLPKLPEKLPETSATSSNVDAIETQNEVTPEQKKFMYFVEQLYQGIKDDVLPVKLNSLNSIYGKVSGILTQDECNRFTEILNNRGFIKTEKFKVSEGLKSRDYILQRIKQS